jgi:hypothetical protein
MTSVSAGWMQTTPEASSLGCGRQPPTALTAAVSIEMPASLRQLRRRSFGGSSRRAAEDSMAESFWRDAVLQGLAGALDLRCRQGAHSVHAASGNCPRAAGKTASPEPPNAAHGRTLT